MRLKIGGGELDDRLVPRFGVVIRGLGAAACMLVLLSATCQIALASDSENSPQAAVPVTPCSLAQPGSITQALVCTKKAEAMRKLDEADCHSGDAREVLEVLAVWRGREALPDDAAARDPDITAFMADCLVEAASGLHPLEPPEESAEMHLRKALNDPNDAIAGEAMAGLLAVLTAADVPAFVKIGSTRPALAIASVGILNTRCDAWAKEGVQSIRAAYAGSPKGVEIDQYLAQTGELCDATGHPIPQEFTSRMGLSAGEEGTAWPPAPPTAEEVKEALESQAPAADLRELLQVQCWAQDTAIISEMRHAWRERDSQNASAAKRDPVIQAVIAACLIGADAASTPATQDALDSAALLRTAIRGNDVMAVVCAVQGLSILDEEHDVRLIADVPKRMPALLNPVIKVLGLTCGANNLKTIALIRREAGSKDMRQRIDLVYSRVAPARAQTCGAGKQAQSEAIDAGRISLAAHTAAR